MSTSLPKGTKSARVCTVPADQIEKLRVLPQVRFKEIDEDQAENLAFLIARDGQQTPCVGRQIGQEIEIDDGRHRRHAILKINRDPVKYGLAEGETRGLDVKILVLSDEAAYDVALTGNVTQLTFTAMDYAQAASILKNRGLAVHEIALRLSTPSRQVASSRVSQLLTLMTLPRSVQEWVHSGKLSEATARQILRREETVEGIVAAAEGVIAGTTKSRDVTASANAERRARGKVVKRNLYEILSALEACDAKGAQDFLAWCQGEQVEFPTGAFHDLTIDAVWEEVQESEQVEGKAAEGSYS